MYRSLRNEKGQTVVEYVMVVTISLVVVLGTVYQLNQNFRNYMSNYFGLYVRCLLESGELPNLGINQDPNSFCDDQFQPFSLAFGRPTVEDSIYDDLSTNQAGGGNSSSDSSSTSGPSGGSDGASSSGRDQTFSQSGSASPLGANGSMRPSRITIDPNKGAAKEDKKEGSGAVTTRSVRRSQQNDPTQSQKIRNQQGRPTYFQGSRIEEEARDEQNILGQVDEKNDTNSLRKRAIIQQQRKPTSKEDVKEEGFDIATMIRYLLIASILIALILFLLGQFLSIQKSMDKG